MSDAFILKRNRDNSAMGHTDSFDAISASADLQHGSTLALEANAVSYNLHLASCWERQKTDSSFIMPWECNMSTPSDVAGKMMKFMQVKGNIPPFPIAASFGERVNEAVIVEDALKKSKIPRVKASHDKVWEKQLTWDRKCACKKWLTIITTELGAWEVVRQLAASRSMELGRGNLVESVYDSFAAKATSTLHNRAGPIIKYIAFWKDKGLKPLPIQETMVYSYIKHHLDAPPSAPRSLLVSLSFAYHVLGLEGGNVAEYSGRVKGVADGHFCNRKKINQKDPLKVEQVMALEAIVHDGERSKFDRIAAGYSLFLIYGRLRFSDTLYVSNLELDLVESGNEECGFLEAMAEKTKTSTTLERKVRHLPVVIY